MINQNSEENKIKKNSSLSIKGQIQSQALINVQQVSEIQDGVINFYYVLVKNDFYLPQFDKDVINEEYLLKVVKNDVFCPKNDQIKPGGAKAHQRCQRIQIFNEINQALEQKQLKKTGFSCQCLPNLKYLINVLWVLDPENSIFQKNIENFGQNIHLDLPMTFFDGVNLRIYPVKREQNLVKLVKQDQKGLHKQKIDKAKTQIQNRLIKIEDQKQKIKLKAEILKQKLQK